MAGPTVDRRGWTLPRILAVGAVLAIVLFWVWILSGAPRKQHPDYLQDRAWTARAEATCASTMAAIDRLPDAPTSEAAAERADVVDAANDELEAMLDRLDGDQPTGRQDMELVRPWLSDWRTYLDNRRDYAARLRTDPGARLFVDEKFGDSIETVIGTFAEVNKMDSCTAPGDVG